MVNISEVVVSANKWEQKRSEISSKIVSIKPKDIEFQNPQTTADILANSGEVFVQKSQMGGGSPMIRGFATSSVLIIIDGVRLNNAIYRQGNLQNVISLDANVMDESEILFGPGSVIYGSDALGGVMAFNTRKPIFSTSDKLLVKTNALIRYSSANNENTGHVDIVLGNKRFSSVSSFTYSRYQDLTMGSVGNNNSQYLRENYIERINQQDSIFINEDKNLQKFSGFSQFNIMQKFRVQLSDYTEISYGFHYSETSDIPRYDALRQESDGVLKYAEWNYGPQHWNMHMVEFKHNKPTLLYDELKWINAYQNYKESRITRKYNSVEQISQNEEVQIFSSNLDMHKSFNEKLSTHYGVEFIYNGLFSDANTKHVDTHEVFEDWTMPRYPDGENDYFSAAAYIGSTFKMSKKLVLNSGIRYSYVQLHSSFENEHFSEFGFNDFTNKNQAVNGSLGLALKPNKDIQINTNLSSGFQAPNWDGLGKVFSPKNGIVLVPNQDLKPQYAYNAEMGYLQYFNNRKISFELVGFYTLLNNPIVQDNFTFNGLDSVIYQEEMQSVEAFVNVKNAHIYGLNLSLNANIFNSLGLKSHLTVSQGADNNGDRLRHISPLFGSTHLYFHKPKFKTDVYLQYNGEVSNLPNAEKGKDYMYAINDDGELFSPSWFTLNLKMSYQVIKNLQVNFGIENILDARYRPYSSGIVSPGRNFIFALRFKV